MTTTMKDDYQLDLVRIRATEKRVAKAISIVFLAVAAAAIILVVAGG
jgi:hypothetical protein